MAERKEMTVEERQRLHLDLLFSKYIEREPAEDLESISEYFEYVAQGIRYEQISIDIPANLLSRFESACLLLRDRLRLYPESVQEQVAEILRDTRIERLFAIFATLSDDDRKRIQRQSFLARLLASLPYLLRIAGAEDDDLLPSRRSLFDAKIALTRLAQIVRYAASIELLDYDSGTEELKDHYDPTLVDKAKILALINTLRVQVNSLGDSDIRERLSDRLNQLDEEIRRQRPRWGRIIAAAFILFGFLADLKTLNPTAYDSLYRTTQAIIKILHVEGSVEHHRRPPLLPSGQESQFTVLPSPVRIEPEIHEEDE